MSRLRSESRLRVLERLDVMDTPREPVIDELTSLAAQVLSAPVAIVALVAAERQFLKSSVGLPEPAASSRHVPLTHSFCKYVVGSGEPMAIGDTRNHPLAKGNRAIEEYGVIAYLGVPLISREGEIVGSFCAVDRKPREWSASDERVLRTLASAVMAQFELKRELRERVEREVMLALQAEQLRLQVDLMDLANDAVVVRDLEGKVLFWNRGAESTYGLDRSQVLGRGVDEVLATEYPRPLEMIEEELSGKGLWEGELVQYTPSLGRMVVASRWVLQRTASGKPRAVLQINRDMTEEQRGKALLMDREARLRSIVETAVDGILVIDQFGQIEMFNKAAEKLFGHPADEVLGLNVNILMPEPNASLHAGYIKRYLDSGISHIMGTAREVVGKRKDGTTFPLDLSLSVMRIGQEPKFTGILRDATQRHQYERELKSSNAMLEAIRKAQLQFIADAEASEVFAGMLQAVLELTESQSGFVGEYLEDPEGEPRLKVYTFGGVSMDGAAQRFIDDYAPEGLIFQDLDNLFGRVLKGGGTFICNDPASDPRRGGVPAGHPRLDSFMGVPVLRAGRVVGMIGIANRPGGYDPSLASHMEPCLSTCASLIEGYRGERRKQETELELQASKEAAEAASRAKSEFLANMSHEVRTPVAAMIGFADLLLDPGLSQSERARALQAIRQNGQHLTKIIDDILDLSKIEAGKLVLEQIPYDPWRIVVEVASLLRVRADAKGVRLDVEPVGPIPPELRTDPTRLRQILVNFLSNAIKFTQSEHRVTLRLFTERSSDRPGWWMAFEVEDEGIGMSDSQLQKLFEPFLQGDTSTTRKYGGTGLGLSICKRLIEALGGVLRVRSKEGEGSCFTASIPLNGAPPEDKWLDAKQLRTQVRVEPTLTRSVYSKVRSSRILLAEDNPDIQRVLTYHLKAAGAEVVVVENGQSAVETGLSMDFDLILMDMQMPELDGYGATSSLRHSGYQGPIIALTAHALREDRERCLRAGCTEYLTKPVSLPTLLDTLERVLSAEIAPASEPVSDDPGDEDSLPPEMVHEYLSDLTSALGDVRARLEREDLSACARMAHQIKGAAGMYGFPAISQAAQGLEQACRSGNREGVAQGMLEELEEQTKAAWKKSGPGGIWSVEYWENQEA